MFTPKKAIRAFLGVPLTIISFAFILKIFFDNRELISDSVKNLDPILFMIGLIFFASFFALKSFAWIQILKKRGYTPNIRTTLFRYSLSEMKRYVPGSIFAFMGRMDSHADTVPQKETLRGIGIEAILMTLSASIVSLPAIWLLTSHLKTIIPGYLLFGIAVLTIVGFVTFVFIKNRQTLLTYFDSFMILLFSWILYGLGCFFTAISIAYLQPESFSLVLSVFVFSWLAGYLFFITPMGLGVRELVTIAGLSFFMPASIAAAVSILTRIVMILGELIYLGITYSFKILKQNSKILKIDPYLFFVLAAALVYFFYMSTFTVLKHNAFLTGRFDLGNMSQTVWNTSRGDFFTLTDPDGTRIISRMADHSDIFLVLLAPLYWIWSDPRVLLIFQSLSLSVGGVFVYLIAKRVLKNQKISLAISLSFFLNFWVMNENIFDFHSVTVGSSLLLGTYYFLISKRYKLFSLFLILAVMTKENVFLVASMFGVYFFVKEKRRVIGILLTIIPILIFVFLTSFVIPNARGGTHFALQYYSYLGDSTEGIVGNIFLRPQTVLAHWLSVDTLVYFFRIFISTGFLALISPFSLIFALPDFAINTLSANPGLRTYQYHYGAVIIPFVFVATIYGVRKILKSSKANVENILFYYLIFTTLICLYFFSTLPGMKDADNRPFKPNNGAKIEEYLTIIPTEASVSSSNNAAAHLSNRKKIYVIPHGLEEAEFIVMYTEPKKNIEAVNLHIYMPLVTDEKINFYLFKKKTPTACTNCNP